MLQSGCYQQMKTTRESQSVSVAKQGRVQHFVDIQGFPFVLTHRCAVGLLGAWAHFHNPREAWFTEVLLGRRKTCVSLCARSASQHQALLVFVLDWRDRSGHYVPYTSTQQLWQPSLSLSFPSVK